MMTTEQVRVATASACISHNSFSLQVRSAQGLQQLTESHSDYNSLLIAVPGVTDEDVVPGIRTQPATVRVKH